MTPGRVAPKARVGLVSTAALAAATFLACRVGPSTHDAPDAAASAPLAHEGPSAAGTDGAPSPAEPHHREKATSSGESFTADWFTFRLASVGLRIVDVGASRELGRALETDDDLLAVNAGFFDDHDAPLGLSRSRGATLSAFAPKLSGGVLEVDGDTGALFETETYDKKRTPAFAVQCRPRLVVSGHANVRSDDKKRAERTTLCLRDGGKVLSVVVLENEERGPSLFATGHYLETRGCHDALSLDGGPSTGVVYRSAGGPVELPLRGPIRQAIVIRRR